MVIIRIFVESTHQVEVSFKVEEAQELKLRKQLAFAETRLLQIRDGQRTIDADVVDTFGDNRAKVEGDQHLQEIHH